MRTIITLSLLLLLSFDTDAQTRRMGAPEVGRTWSGQHLGGTVYPLLQEAELQFRLQDYEGSFLTLESAVAQDPNSPEALLLRARLKTTIGMYAEAEEDLQLATRMNPYVADLYGYNGDDGIRRLLSFEPKVALQGVSQSQKLTYYYEAIDQKLISDDDLDKIQLLEAAIANIDAGNYDEANEIVETAITRFPESALAYDLKGVIWGHWQDHKAAKKAFLKAVELEPNFAIAWYNLGQIEYIEGNLDQAKAYLDKAIVLKQDLTKAYFERAKVYRAKGEKSNAIEDYNAIIEMRGEGYPEAYVNRGLTKKMEGIYGGALTDMDQVIDEFPDQPVLRKNRGNLYMLLGMEHKAIIDYTDAIRLDKNYAEAYYNRGIAHILSYDMVSGCSDLDQSSELGYQAAKDLKQYFCGEFSR